MCPAWLLVAVVAVGGLSSAWGQCWDSPSCRDLDSESSLLECIQICRSDLSAETPIIPGASHLQVPPPDLSDPAPQAKRSYSMEHFRWGKPVGRKRRPVKVYTANELEEESSEFPGDMKRALASQLEEEARRGPEVLVLENEAGEAQEEVLQQKKKNSDGGGVYKMKHFRWSGPPESKRYGGFMKSWDERGQRPLLTLFKNVINKEPPIV